MARVFCERKGEDKNLSIPLGSHAHMHIQDDAVDQRADFGAAHHAGACVQHLTTNSILPSSPPPKIGNLTHARTHARQHGSLPPSPPPPKKHQNHDNTTAHKISTGPLHPVPRLAGGIHLHADAGALRRGEREVRGGHEGPSVRPSVFLICMCIGV